MEYLTRCIKEGLRLHCPVPFVQRKTTKELQIDDVTLPAGTSFTIHIYNLHHNPQVWNEPMKYDPDRFCAENMKTKDSFAFVPFSAGPRYASICRKNVLLAALYWLILGIDMSLVDKSA